MNLQDIIVVAAKLAGVFGLVLGLAAVLSRAERKVSARRQRRNGAPPLRFRRAPALSAAFALLACAVIPFSFPLSIGNSESSMAIAGINIGLLFTLAMLGLGVYGILLGGLASQKNGEFLGGIRSSAQAVSYGLTLVLSALTVLVLTGSMNMTEIFLAQIPEQFSFKSFFTEGWLLFRLPAGPIAFLLFLVAAFAVTNKLPFELRQDESELAWGSHSQDSSMKFALFFVAEYLATVTMACLLALFFLGGPSLFGLLQGIDSSWLRGLLGFAVFLAKVGLFLFFLIWARWTLRRFRWEQLMQFGWKLLLPIAILNMVVAGAAVAF
ncbi:MAG: NADH-quinone oxidoreductase subunit H [Planctomycetota bacterium]|nr:MAG: NADH-quinone oxidoreductase subunit H [Planctomycetota bacterium]